MLTKADIIKFDSIVDIFKEIEQKISDPEIIQQQSQYQELLKKHAELKEIVEKYLVYQKLGQELTETKNLLTDSDMKEIVQEELKIIEEKIEKTTEELRLFLVPKDPNDKKNAVVEIRAGTGGEEAALFAGELFRMYSRYAEKQGWKVEVLSETLASRGGVKEISLVISGQEVFSRLKFESGTHRVQRVPETEASGRVHTSAATVAILPEVEEVDVKIDTKDLRVDTYRAQGAGGQHVNKTSSAIRITHFPTGIVVACQDERSQFQNKDKAMRLLRAKIYEKSVEDKRKVEAQSRKMQVGSGDRSEKIRTYNFPQNRVTDHRINFSSHALDQILEGEIDPLLEALIAEDRLQKLNQ